MDWNFAIETHREALRHIVAMLVAMAGLGSGGQFTFFPQEGALAQNQAMAEKSKLPPTLPRHLHRTLLRLLRAAEAAARRLIVVAARGLVVLPGPLRLAKPEIISPYGRSGPVLTPSAAAPQQRSHRPILPLIDPLRDGSGRWQPAATSVPRISVPGWSDPAPLAIRPTPTADDPLDAGGIHRRLAALVAALDDLPRQAKRLAPAARQVPSCDAAAWRPTAGLAQAGFAPRPSDPLGAARPSRPGPLGARKARHLVTRLASPARHGRARPDHPPRATPDNDADARHKAEHDGCCSPAVSSPPLPGGQTAGPDAFSPPELEGRDDKKIGHDPRGHGRLDF